jgi:hypothetical protein
MSGDRWLAPGVCFVVEGLMQTRGRSFAAKSRTVEFVTSDKQLSSAGSLESLEVSDPENPE